MNILPGGRCSFDFAQLPEGGKLPPIHLRLILRPPDDEVFTLRLTESATLRIPTYDLRLTTYDLSFQDPDLRLTTHDLRLTTYD
ncbi:MAG TPA: hypothetical protein PKE06_14655 [Flavilitoribacter sp.]|nr:hypothetical protein [Flavilitoribacter sp.]